MLRPSAFALLLFAACGGSGATPADATPVPAKSWQPYVSVPLSGDALADMKADIAALQAWPEHADAEVEVQHVLIAFQETLPGKTMKRTQEEAEKLAADVYVRARNGEDFTSLVQRYTNDSPPGVYPMTNSGTRRNMVQSFGDVAWRLPVGGIGVAPYDPAKSRFGWHIIKRLK